MWTGKYFKTIVGLTNIVNSRRVTFFEIDSTLSKRKLEKIQEICNKYNINIFIFKTTHGFHFISFDVIGQTVFTSVFCAFKILFQESDYIFAPRFLKKKLKKSSFSVLRLSKKFRSEKYFKFITVLKSTNPVNKDLAIKHFGLYHSFRCPDPTFYKAFLNLYKEEIKKVKNYDVITVNYLNTTYFKKRTLSRKNRLYKKVLHFNKLLHERIEVVK